MRVSPRASLAHTGYNQFSISDSREDFLFVVYRENSEIHLDEYPFYFILEHLMRLRAREGSFSPSHGFRGIQIPLLDVIYSRGRRMCDDKQVYNRLGLYLRSMRPQ